MRESQLVNSMRTWQWKRCSWRGTLLWWRLFHCSKEYGRAIMTFQKHSSSSPPARAPITHSLLQNTPLALIRRAPWYVSLLCFTCTNQIYKFSKLLLYSVFNCVSRVLLCIVWRSTTENFQVSVQFRFNAVSFVPPKIDSWHQTKIMGAILGICPRAI